MLEAADDLGGQWNAGAAHSGIWPGMHTNTSRAMTAFSDFPAPASHPLHPAAEQIHAYVRAYAARFGVTAADPVRRPRRARGAVRGGWEVDGEPFDAVAVASGRFRRPYVAPGFERFGGELLHAFDYPGAEAFRGRRVLVYGNGISGLEIASDLAPVADVDLRVPQAALRHQQGGRRRLLGLAVVHGVRGARAQPAAARGAEPRGCAPACCGSRAIRRRSGRPRRTPTSSWRACRCARTTSRRSPTGRSPAARRSPRSSATPCGSPTGRRDPVDAVVCATGYTLDIPYLDPAVWDVTGPALDLYRRTVHPDLPGFGVVGMFLAQGPFFPLLELQARWLVALWAGAAALPPDAMLRTALATPAAPAEVHNVFAAALAGELGVGAGPARAARAHRAAAVRAAAPAPVPVRRTGSDRRTPSSSSGRSSRRRRARPSTPRTSRRCSGFGLADAAELVRAAAQTS